MTVREKSEYVAREVKKKTFDEERVYGYVEELVRIAEARRKYVRSPDFSHKTDFIQEASANIYMRLINPKLPKIDNVLSYIYTVLFGMSVRYKEMNYSKVEDFSRFKNPEDAYINFVYEMNINLRGELEEQRRLTVKNYIESIPTILLRCMEHTRYAKNKEILHNLKISAIITFSNWLTNTQQENIILYENLQKRDGHLQRYYDNWRDRLILKNSTKKSVNYGLTQGQYEYFDVIMRHIKGQIIKELNTMLMDEQVTDELITDVRRSYEDIEDLDND